MTHRSSRILSLAALALLVAALATTTIAHAIPSESLSWVRTYAGPDNIPVFEQDPIHVAGGFNAVSFTDASHGWAVGVRVNNVAPQGAGRIDSLVAFTTDGGSSWTSSTAGVARELRGVDAIAVDDVWAVGDYGTMVHWNGAWSSRSVSGWTVGKRFNAVSFFDSQHGWAVGDGRGVAYTSNGGLTWKTIATPGSTGALYGVAAQSATSALAVGDSGLIKALSATAVTSKATVTGTLYGVTFADADHVWAVGSGAAIYRSSNGGSTWSAAPRPLPADLTASDLTMRSVAFFNRYDGVIVGTYQTVWRTSNGGAAWVADRILDSHTGGDYELRGVAFADAVAAPVTVGRAYGGYLSSQSDKASAYQGSWTNIPDPSTVDITPPVTTSDRVAYYANSATILLSATDDRSGVAHTYYILDSGAPVEVSTVTVGRAGAHSLEFWSVDLTGNIESHHRVTFTVVTPPSSSGTPSTPSTPATVKHGKPFTAFGYIVRRTAGTSPVTLLYYRWQKSSGKYKWVLRKSVTAKVFNVLTFSKYWDSTSMPYTGKWRVRARHKVGAGYKYSKYRTFTAN